MSGSIEVSSGSVSLVTAFGTGFAVALSWFANHSIGWAILHAIMGWVYVAYWIGLRLCERLAANGGVL